MALGLSILALCVTGGQVALAMTGGHPAAQVLREALIIFGWVANWKPLQTFLYDGWPLRRRLRLLRRLAAAQVVLDPAGNPS
jgi:hypothetical protein